MATSNVATKPHTPASHYPSKLQYSYPCFLPNPLNFYICPNLLFTISWAETRHQILPCTMGQGQKARCPLAMETLLIPHLGWGSLNLDFFCVPTHPKLYSFRFLVASKTFGNVAKGWKAPPSFPIFYQELSHAKCCGDGKGPSFPVVCWALPSVEHVGNAKDMGAFNNITMAYTELVGVSCIDMNQKSFADDVYMHP